MALSPGLPSSAPCKYFCLSLVESSYLGAWYQGLELASVPQDAYPCKSTPHLLEERLAGHINV